MAGCRGAPPDLRQALDGISRAVNDAGAGRNASQAISNLAEGIQAMGTTLSSMRDIIHSLRGWPTPFGATLNVLQLPFENPGSDSANEALQACQTVAEEVVQFAKAWRKS